MIEKKNNRQMYCSSCWKEKQEIKRDWKRKYDKSRKFRNYQTRMNSGFKRDFSLYLSYGYKEV